MERIPLNMDYLWIFSELEGKDEQRDSWEKPSHSRPAFPDINVPGADRSRTIATVAQPPPSMQAGSRLPLMLGAMVAATRRRGKSHVRWWRQGARGAPGRLNARGPPTRGQSQQSAVGPGRGRPVQRPQRG